MNILVGCEISGTVRDAFTAKGHNAFSCDIKPSEHPRHIQMDVFFVLTHPYLYCDAKRWDLVIMHPPCTALAVSGNRWYGKGMPRHAERIEAMRWTANLWETCERFARSQCFENPVGVLGHTYMGKATQYVQPWQFGHTETKKTGFWLRNLPKLTETHNVKDQLDAMSAKDKHKVWYMSPGPERAALRSLTYQGIADAMADQWGDQHAK